MKKSLLKNFSRTLLVLACCLVANNAWADFTVYVKGPATTHVYLWYVDNNGWPGVQVSETENIGGIDWYKIPVTGDVSHIIFNTGNNTSQTSDIYNISSTKFYIYDGISTATDVSGDYLMYLPHTVAGATNETAAGESDLIFGTSWNANDNVMTTSDNNHFTWTSSPEVQLNEGDKVIFKVVRNSTDWIGDVNGNDIEKTAPSDGTYILNVKYTYNGVPEGNLCKINTLADLCSNGEVNNNYKISDELVVVDYVTSGDAIFLQCKDDNNSIEKVSPGKNSVGVDQVDFLFNDKDAQNGRAWDQSNWIALWLQGGNNTDMLARAQAAKGHKISGVIGEYSDANNYTMKVQYNDFTIGAEASYTPNVYCVANFNPANLNPANLATANPYFFMTPKVQEICHITYAQWNGTTFTVPSGSQHQGTLALDYAFNDGGNPSANLTVDKLYQFDAIVQLHDGNGAPALKANSGNYRVAPTNLTGGENNNFTAISTVGVNGEVKSVKYVNVAGVVSDRPFQGVNIVVTEYTDGSRTTAKVVK